MPGGGPAGMPGGGPAGMPEGGPAGGSSACLLVTNAVDSDTSKTAGKLKNKLYVIYFHPNDFRFLLLLNCCFNIWKVTSYKAQIVFLSCILFGLEVQQKLKYFIQFWRKPYIDTVNQGNWCLSIKLRLECFVIVA